jgi:zinc finger protein
MADEDAPFKPISAELGEVIVLTSRCMQCEEDGETRMMFTQVPHFKEIIVSSFECPHCGEKNSEVKFGGSIQPWKIRIELNVTSKDDLDRQLVRSEFATISIPEVEFEIPAQKGTLTTVEGILQTSIDDLRMYQSVRRIEQPELFAQIETFICKLEKLRSLEATPFHIVIADPSGNSFIQNRNYPRQDPLLTVERKQRTVKEDKYLCLLPDDHPDDDGRGDEHSAQFAYNTGRTDKENKEVDDGEKESIELPDNCYACGKPGVMKMAVIDIPHFNETILMSFKCDFCAYKTTEVKSGGAVSEKGTRYALQVKTPVDLARDVLKSATCSIEIPEIEFECSEGTLGSMFTTVEGLISQMLDQLAGVQQAGFHIGDSITPEEQGSFRGTLKKMLDMKEGRMPFTLIMDDPLSHSYLQSTADDPKDDPNLTKAEYMRTEEQDEDLGINYLRETEKDYGSAPRPAPMQHNTQGSAHAAHSKAFFHDRKMGAPLKITPEFDEENRKLKQSLETAAASKAQFNARNDE